MTSLVLHSPNSSPSAASPTSEFSPPTLSTSPLNSSAGVIPPTASQPEQTTETPVASSPSSSSATPLPTSTVPATPPSPSAVPATPPPSTSTIPATPPTSTVPATPSPPLGSFPQTSAPPLITLAPPPSVPAFPPPTTPASPPPPTPGSPPTSTTTSSPPTTPASPPPSTPATAPPSESTAPRTKTSPPPQSSFPPVTVIGSPPSPAPPALSPPPPPPPPQGLSPASPSSPVNPTAPPTPKREPPAKSSPPALTTPPPSGSQSGPPPSSDGPPGPALPSSPPSIPSTTSPPSTAPSAPRSDSEPSRSPPLSPLPSIPTEKTTARSTDGVSSNFSSTHKGSHSTRGAAIGVAVGFVMHSLLVIAVWFINKQKRRRTGSRVRSPWSSPGASSQNSATVFIESNSHARFYGSASGSELMCSPLEQGGLSNSKACFTYEELVQATKGFSEENLLGEGGFGCVFKGLISDGREVAVKQLKIGSGQGEREFRAEVEIISRLHHRHLVSLVGYCISEHQRLLVYEYVPNNTLHNHLHGVDRPVMSWGTRVRVAAGSARGIAYLHEDCLPRIIHRDIKSSNILLDNIFEAHVADFGLAKLALDSNTHVTTRVMGTFMNLWEVSVSRYMAPEYATSGKLNEKSDVYSFGVVLLELITGRMPVDTSQPIGDESLVEWARPLLNHALENEDFEGLVDPRLENNYDPREMFRIIEAAAACIRHSAAKRPRMSQLVRALVSLDELSDLTNGLKPGQSEVFNSAEQSAQIRMFQRMAFGSQDYSTNFFNQTQSSWSREQGDSNVFPHNNKSEAWNV